MSAWALAGALAAGVGLGFGLAALLPAPGLPAQALAVWERAGRARIEAEARAYAAEMGLRAAAVREAREAAEAARAEAERRGSETVAAVAAAERETLPVAALDRKRLELLRADLPEALRVSGEEIEALFRQVAALRDALAAARRETVSVRELADRFEELAQRERAARELAEARAGTLEGRQRWKLRWGVGATAGAVKGFGPGWSPGASMGLTVLFGR